ncbi:MAG: L-histidine N(alpha)-methyltransferase [Bauldia sp.]
MNELHRKSSSRFLIANELRASLSRPQKEIPSKYLYDEVGSALFEVITELPQYGVSRAEERILVRHSSEIVELIQRPVDVVELGSGSGRKTRWLLESLTRAQPARLTRYFPIDISRAALGRSRAALGQIPSLSIVGFERDYLDGLREAVLHRQPGEGLLVLFLGSTIGNFERPAAAMFLKAVRQLLRPDDALLLATDLVKPTEVLQLAYDDPLGVTAAFNRNVLAGVNRDLDGDFDLEKFSHQARYNHQFSRIEMHLVARERHFVNLRLADLRLEFEAGETIWTESSHKFDAREIWSMASGLGFRSAGQWTDETWPFAETLWLAD